ncbi:MAG TPA: calcium-binding protein [Thermoanaerobaculia bacterium]|nr:calcium-binding protein [Thermoanaerobaculia bacterium]
MSKSETGVAVAFALGVVLMLTASPASALCGPQCDCSSSCDEICYDGPFVPDCPECNQSTCGAFGECIESSSCEPQGSCIANSCTSTINGTNNGEALTGNSNHECINGLGGADTLTGNAGDDTIHGGSDNDTAYGNSGNNCLYGDDGNDNLTGGTGNDYTDGGNGTDTCVAESEVNCEL